MSGSFTQNQFNTLILPIQCRVNVASYRDIAVRITGALQIDTLHAVSIKTQMVVILLWHRSDDRVGVFQLNDVFVKTDCMFFLFPLQLKFKILELVASASVELPSSSPMFLHEERPVRHVSLQQLNL